MAAETLSLGVGEADPGLLRRATDLTLRTWPRETPVDPAEEAKRRRDEARAYEGPAERRPMLHAILDGERLIAVARTFERVIGTDDGRMSILALSGVVVEEDRRGEGLGRTVVRAAFARVDDGIFGFSLFQTATWNRGFYEGLGARVVDNPITNSLATPGMRMPVFNPDELVVVYPNRPGWPAGTIDLLGPGY